MKDVLIINKIKILNGKAVCDISVDSARCFTNAKFASCITKIRPKLVKHSCMNEGSDFFGDVISNTGMHHLLEHLIIDFQVSANPSSTYKFAGNSYWVDKDQGLAQVSVNFYDDLIVLKAIQDAKNLINKIEFSCYL